MKMNDENYDFMKQITDENTYMLEKPIKLLKLELASEETNKRRKAIEELKQDDYVDNLIEKCSSTETELWVEKFKPRDFFELLSEDSTNRLILTWIKSWDYSVFGKELDKSKIENRVVMKETTNINSKKRKRPLNLESELEEKLLELDDMNRPKTKVALISGPPGLGKTTLAQIIAKRAGYNVIEMNASDDRSIEMFKIYLESVTQMRGSVNETTFKPNCLIIDEIDGAPQNSIQILIDHVTENSKTKNKKTNHCLRPIICICNDLYTPSLKNLRQVAIVFQCQAISTHRLAERLKNICILTNIESDIDAMVSLCDKTNNDIRSSLNTLQFLSKRTNRVTSKIINELNIGQKDMEKGIFTIMNEIFFKKYEKKDQNIKTDANSRFNAILNMCQNCDFDRLLQALQENFLYIRFRDSNFENIIKANEWFTACDKFSKISRDNQDFGLLRYQRFIPGLFHTLFSSLNQQIQTQNKRFKYPHQHFEFLMKFNRNNKIITNYLTDMSPSARVFSNSGCYSIIDLIPYLCQIIQPTMRAVSIQLLNKSEKERFDSIIKTMLLFNLTYRQEKGAEGQFSFVLEPSIDELIKFTGLKQHKQLSYIIKQQIARELTISKVKIADKSKGYLD
ncbi:chromosome transmission fidelity 8 -like protein [Brachionus plicatilis]|uniref:Chromosome transmission fidelity 8-like protein n=1 Tax=Brachionus plicatilis TaxID=10195 RepID=A0A3M7T679_BRAPC|nr:chromosome transmission fidelity 8 -like protein [Brachionus plicatilis]